MPEAPAVPTPPPSNEPPAAAPTPPTPTPIAPAAPPVEPAPTEPAGSGLPDDPAALQGMIRELRKENANRRTASNTAAEDAKKELAQTIGKALGLVEDETVDPAKLTESLTTAQADAKRAQVALAVYQNAGTVGDPVALLDSTTFLKSVAAIDPSDTAAISAAITAAVTANPRLGAAPAGPTPPAPNPAQGAGASGAPGIEAQIAEATKAGNHRLAITLKRQLHASQATT